MFTASFRDKCLRDLREKIELPAKGFFKRNEDNIRLSYRIGTKLKYIYLTSPIDVAEFLIKHGMIYTYSIVGEVVHMYTKTVTAVSGSRGCLVWQQRMVTYKWEEIELCEDDVLHMAAVQEFEEAGGLMGAVPAKVISISQNFFRAA